MIVGEIRRYLRDNNQIRVSRSLRDLAYKALKARETLTYRLGREPDSAEIAAETGCDPKEVAMALDAIQDPVSLKQAMAHLGEREQGIIEKRYFEGRTQMEVAEEIGISQAQVSRLEKAALRQMQRYV